MDFTRNLLKEANDRIEGRMGRLPQPAPSQGSPPLSLSSRDRELLKQEIGRDPEVPTNPGPTGPLGPQEGDPAIPMDHIAKMNKLVVLAYLRLGKRVPDVRLDEIQVESYCNHQPRTKLLVSTEYKLTFRGHTVKYEVSTVFDNHGTVTPEEIAEELAALWEVKCA